MICPAAPPSAATPNMSAANWLNRLRSSRGFPSADGVDLGHFLAAEASGDSAAAPESPRVSNSHAVAKGRGAPNGGQLGEREQLAEILRELFAMGGGGESSNDVSSKRKSSRKQQNPKFWDATCSSKKNSNEYSSDDFRRRSNNGFVSSGDNSLNQRHKERDSKDPGELGFWHDEEEEEVDLKGYSKSDVTVIDSSVQGWKSQMFVFRRSKGVWKVREKKSKSRSLMRVRRKRKLVKANSSDKDDDDNKDDSEERKKKKKKKKTLMKDSGSAPGSLSENGNGKEHAVVPFINEGQFRDDKIEQILNGASSLHHNAPIKSFPCSSSHWKLKSEASSVILVKPISTLDQIRTKKPGKLSVNKEQSLL